MSFKILKQKRLLPLKVLLMKQYTVNVQEDKSELFEQLMSSLDFAEVNSEDWWNDISHKSKQLIKKGMQELREGKGIPHEEVRKKMDNLLGKS